MAARYLIPCLESLRRQTFTAFRVVVVDDGSTDGTVAMLRRDFPTVGVVRFARNGGLARAQNAGIAAAESEYVAVLNNDTEAEPTWLERLVAAADAHPGAWAVAGKLRLWDRRDVLHAAGDGFGVDGVPRNLGVWERDDGRGTTDGGSGARRAVRRSSGGRHSWRYPGRASVRRTMSHSSCTAKMLISTGARGWPVIATAFAPDAIVYHHLSATAGGPLASYYIGRNMLAVLVKDVPIATDPAVLAADALRPMCASCARVLAISASRRRVRDCADSAAIVPMLPMLLRQRRAVQRPANADTAALDRLLYAPEREYARIGGYAAWATVAARGGNREGSDAGWGRMMNRRRTRHVPLPEHRHSGL